MARQRREAKGGDSGAGSGGEFVCPECGKAFTRAASLGAHRQRAHGVAGTSKKTASSRGLTQAQASGRRGRRSSGRRRSGAAAPAASGARRDGQRAVSRDQLLQALFPNGVPPREDVIRRLSSWLDEAERLAKL
jgi:hypothetical protein